jgi:hypothetical protein
MGAAPGTIGVSVTGERGWSNGVMFGMRVKASVLITS